MNHVDIARYKSHVYCRPYILQRVLLISYTVHIKYIQCQMQISYNRLALNTSAFHINPPFHGGIRQNVPEESLSGVKGTTLLWGIQGRCGKPNVAQKLAVWQAAVCCQYVHQRASMSHNRRSDIGVLSIA